MLSKYFTVSVETYDAMEPEKDAISTAFCLVDEPKGSAECTLVKFVASDHKFKFNDDVRRKYEQ